VSVPVNPRVTREPRLRSLICVAVLALTALAAVLVIADVTASIRPLVIFIAALAVPGTAIVLRLPEMDGIVALGLVVGFSLAVEVIVALALVWTRWWHPSAGAGAIAVVSAVLVLDELRRARRQDAPASEARA
jgi:uncharacterized membrane protein